MYNRFNEDDDDAQTLAPIDELLAAAKQAGQLDKIGDAFSPESPFNWAHASWPPNCATRLLDMQTDFRFQDVLKHRVRFGTLRYLLSLLPYWEGEDWIVAFGSLCDPLAEYSGTPVLMNTDGGRILDVVWSKDLLWVKRFKVLCLE